MAKIAVWVNWIESQTFIWWPQKGDNCFWKKPLSLERKTFLSTNWISLQFWSFELKFCYCFSFNLTIVSRVGKNMAAMPWSCHDHTMIMAKHSHDHAMMTAWRPCFLAWSSWFMAWSWYGYYVFHDSYHDHGMIIMFSMFFSEEKLDWLLMFSQIVAAIYHYMAHLTGFRGIHASKLANQQN